MELLFEPPGAYADGRSISQSILVTVLITEVTVAVELVLGFALAMVMAKALSAIRPILRRSRGYAERQTARPSLRGRKLDHRLEQKSGWEWALTRERLHRRCRDLA